MVLGFSFDRTQCVTAAQTFGHPLANKAQADAGPVRLFSRLLAFCHLHLAGSVF